MSAPPAISRPAWWVDPTRLLVLFILPVLLLTVIAGPASLRFYRNFTDNYNDDTIALGIVSLLALACGTVVARLLGGRAAASTHIDSVRATIALRVLGVVAVAAYVMLLGPWLLNPETVFQMLEGGGGSSYALREQMNQVPGVTSFVHVSVIFCALFSAARLDPTFRTTRDLWLMLGILAACAFARAILGSERLALIEFVVPLCLAHAAFRWRPSLLRTVLPLIAVVGVFMLFSVGEYFRSWQFYWDQGVGSFWDFSLTRFAGYYSVALNNGMGVYLMHSPLNVPRFTASWIYKFPLWPLLGIDIGGADMGADFYFIYLQQIGNPEFNNLSGIYAPLIDYGVGLGLLCMTIVGLFVGTVYRSFSQLQPIGLILYPTCYIGVLELVRLFYLGDQRLFPVFLSAACVILFVRERPGRLKRQQALVHALLPDVEGAPDHRS